MIFISLPLPNLVIRVYTHDLIAALARHYSPITNAQQELVSLAQKRAEFGAPLVSERPRKYLVLVLVNILFDVRRQVESYVEVHLCKVRCRVITCSDEICEHHRQCVLEHILLVKEKELVVGKMGETVPCLK